MPLITGCSEIMPRCAFEVGNAELNELARDELEVLDFDLDVGCVLLLRILRGGSNRDAFAHFAGVVPAECALNRGFDSSFLEVGCDHCPPCGKLQQCQVQPSRRQENDTHQAMDEGVEETLQDLTVALKADLSTDPKELLVAEIARKA